MGPGQLNGSLTSYAAEANSLGQVSAFFNAPYSDEDALLEVSKTEHIDGSTHMTVGFTATVVPSEVWVFQILKHDPVLGTVGDAVSVVAAGAALEPNGLGFADVYMAYTEDYNGGTMLLEDSGGVRRSLPIRWAELQYDGNGEPFVRFFLESQAQASWISGSEKAWLFQEEAVEWDAALRRGARVILYEWSAGAQHPVTGVAGAFHSCST